MTKPSKPVPDFGNEAEERAFWESPKNDSTSYVDGTKAKRVTFPLPLDVDAPPEKNRTPSTANCRK
jgi:hypothetical protein